MRRIDELIWHCTATPEGREVSRAEVDRWHKERGWSGIGYHKLVHLDGSVSEGRPESQIGAHVANKNTGTIGYAYVGGVAKDGKTPKDTRTAAQKKTMLRLTKDAISKYKLKRVTGHHDYAAKACPSFPAKREYASLLLGDQGMPDKDPAIISQSKTVQGSALTGVGVMGGVVTEVTDQISPLAGYSQWIGAVFVILSLIGIGIVVYARLKDAGWFDKERPTEDRSYDTIDEEE